MAKAAKTVALLDKAESQALERFCVLHHLKDALVALLKSATETHELKRGEITTAANAPYERLLGAIGSAVSNGWISENEFVSLLDNGEFAGRQHICLFRVKATEQAKILNSLRNPSDLDDTLPALDSFYSTPKGWTTRIISDKGQEFVAKIVGPREYWDLDEQMLSEDHIQIDKRRQRERSAIIIKYQSNDKLLQLRLSVSIRRYGQETGKAVHDLLEKAIKAQCGDEGKAWFDKLEYFPIADSYPKIMKNKNDFVLDTDTPYDHDVKATMARRGTYDVDLRDNPHWTFGKDCARSSIRGFWLTPNGQAGHEGINTFLHEDSLKIDSKTTKKMARIFIIKSCTDGDIEHVIQRIRDHIS